MFAEIEEADLILQMDLQCSYKGPMIDRANA